MAPDELKSALGTFRQKKILVVGDVMLDRFLWGSASRISPEAPVPVVRVERESQYPGGAANVARNLVPFAGEVGLLGVAGPGPDGDRLCELLAEGGIGTAGLLRSPGRLTIVKTRVIARNQQIVRIDHEDAVPLTGDELARARGFLESQIGRVDAVIVEDYGKGLVTQALVDSIAAIAGKDGPLVTVDPNPNNPLRWRGVAAVKPNRHEAFLAAGIPEVAPGADAMADETLQRVAARLFEVWDTENLLITLGDHGMALCRPGVPPYHVPTKAKEVFDVSGAGDTAIALFTLALAAGLDPRVAADIANHASGIVVGKVGTAVLTPDELAASFA